jgi:hypothetical protein
MNVRTNIHSGQLDEEIATRLQIYNDQYQKSYRILSDTLKAAENTEHGIVGNLK